MSDPQPFPPSISLGNASRAVERYGPDLLRIPGVLAVRPGYRIVGRRLTGEPAVVVTVKAKRPLEELPPEERLPWDFEGVPVDVLQADPRDMEEDPPPPLDTWSRLLEPPAMVMEAAPEIGYRSPEDLELVGVEIAEAGSVLCHVSPDTGWATLRPFLQGAQERLTVAMYDFYASHIVDELAALGANPALRLELILQTDPNKEDVVVERLRQAWQNRLDYTPAAIRGPRRVFANAYHTKVAVRDGKAFWLSSGNWTPTSQPEIPPGPMPTLYNRGNREWHAIVEDADLAGVFEGFIRHDIRQAKKALAAGVPEAMPAPPDLLIPESAFVFPEALVEQPAPFAPAAFPLAGETLRVQPLMTPDNYTEAVLELIENTEESLYLQYSYIYAPKEMDGYGRIIDAVTRKIADGLDVRIIVGQRNQKPVDTQKLQALGWDLQIFRYQSSKVHNKGIISDSKAVLVGSQNWSPSGAQYNRDASLILHSPEVAAYFRSIFLFDWESLTKPPSLPEVVPMVAESNLTPPGMVRLPWRSWFED